MIILPVPDCGKLNLAIAPIADTYRLGGMPLQNEHPAGLGNDMPPWCKRPSASTRN